MNGSLTLVSFSPDTSPTEPLSLAAVKMFLNLPDPSPDDSLIEDLIAGARNQAEIAQGRDLVRKRWELSLDRFPCGAIELRAPLVSVQSVTYRDSDGVEYEFTDYIVDLKKQPGIIMPAYGESWPSFTPWPSSAVSITFTSGYESGDVFWLDNGKRVIQGMKLLITHWYTGRLPFELGAGAVQEYPFAVTSCLGYGSIARDFACG